MAGKANSIATIFSLDIYQKIFNKNATEKNLVNVGKLTIVISMVLAIIIAPHLGIDKKGGFQYIQEYTGFVSPGVFAMFLLGFFWKKTTSNAALFATIVGFLLSIVLKFLPDFMDLSFLASTGFSVPVNGVYEIPFIDRIGFVFIFCLIGMYFISIYENKKGVVAKGLEIDSTMFKTKTGFAVGALLVIGITAALYTIFW